MRESQNWQMQDLCLPKDNSMTLFVYEINFSKSSELWIILCVYTVSPRIQKIWVVLTYIIALAKTRLGSKTLILSDWLSVESNT